MTRKKKLVAIIQARMSSSRLPRKVLRKIGGKPMLHYVVKQTRGSKLLDEIIIATTNEKKDDAIVEFCKNNKLRVFRGSKHDLLDRYYQCAKKYGASIIVRITSDCPFIDPGIIDDAIHKFLNGHVDYLGNNIAKKNGKWDNHTCGYPQGNTVEVCSFSALERAWMQAIKPSEREHVFPFIQFNPKIFKITNIKSAEDFSYIRCTVDRDVDLNFVRRIYEKIPNKKHVINTIDIVNVVRKYPYLLEIGRAHV